MMNSLKLKLSTLWVGAAICLLAYGCSGPARHYVDDSSGGNGNHAGSGNPNGGTDSGAGNGNPGGGTDNSAGAGNNGNGGSSSGGDTSIAGEGGEGGVAGGGNEAGTGGVIIVQPPPPPGQPGVGIVPGGILMKSAKYTLVVTTGEEPGGNGVYTSSKYRFTGGLVGTMQP